MKKKINRHLLVLMLFCLALSSCRKDGVPDDNDCFTDNKNKGSEIEREKGVLATMSVFATGLNNPRGLKFGPDCHLYVAEAGIGGKNSTVGLCAQVGPAFPPYLGSTTGGRISKINKHGVRTTVTDQLPTSISGTDILGPSDVAFIQDKLYVLLSGAGCSHGVPSVPNGILKVNSNGTSTVIADLGSWQIAHPAANTVPADFEPEGVWYNFVASGNGFYALEPNHGDLVKVGLNGSINRIVDISASKGHIVPTALTYKENLFVGNLGRFPISGKSSIFMITPSGNITEIATGFSAVLGLVVDNHSRIYVLEMTAGAPFPTPGQGQITRVSPNGNKEVIISGLSLPTGMTMGPDGNLYVSNWGFGMPPGGGQIVKIRLYN